MGRSERKGNCVSVGRRPRLLLVFLFSFQSMLCFFVCHFALVRLRSRKGQRPQPLLLLLLLLPPLLAPLLPFGPPH